MRILHTSDWHLGRQLYGRRRYDEFAAFLSWLLDQIREQRIDILLVAGDVFDTSTPSNRAQELYYQFLCRVADAGCRHVVITAGNHDSPSFLDAPKELLKVLNVHVIGEMAMQPEDEVILLSDGQDRVEAIVCAIPYLHDRDIRTAAAGETLEDKNAKLIAGVTDHYHAVCAIAEVKRQQHDDVPILAMGHLFTAGGRTVDGDGVRELYVGTLAHVGEDAFPSCIDYLALGHLHVPQQVGVLPHRRYSGSPLPMGFGEADQAKSVVIVEYSGTRMAPVIKELAVPCFQSLKRLTGNLEEILDGIDALKREDSKAWLEIEYTGPEIIGNLREVIDEALVGTAMESQRIKNRRVIDRVMNRIQDEETLDDLTVEDVFTRCLDQYEITLEERPELLQAYHEIVLSIQEVDINA